MTTLRMATKLAVLLCCSVAFAQNGADLLDDFSNSLAADLEINGDSINNLQQGFIYNARLDADDKISGRLQMKYATGKTTPADARIEFAQDGNVVGSSRTDADGRFETAGLTPGDYLAKVTVGEDTAEVPVKILAHDPNATSEIIIEGTLTPVPEGELIVANGCSNCGEAPVHDEIMVEQPVLVEESACSTCAPAEEVVVSESFMPDAACGCAAAPVSSGFQSGCGACGGGGFGGRIGGGGFRLGGALGAAGLAVGVTALALDDDDAVSPAAP